MKRFFVVILAAILTACGGGGGSNNNQEPVVKPVTILVTGDSTREMGSPSVPESVERILNVEVENTAKGGSKLWERMSGVGAYNTPLNTLLKNYKDVKIVTENFGINEAFGDTDMLVYEQSLREFVYTVRANGMTPVLITPNPTFGQEIQKMRFDSAVALVRSIAKEYNVALIDVHEQFKDVQTSEYLDAVHPSQNLLNRIAEYEAQELQKILNALNQQGD